MLVLFVVDDCLGRNTGGGTLGFLIHVAVLLLRYLQNHAFRKFKYFAIRVQYMQ